MTKGDIKKCNVCQEFVKCNETDEEIIQTFKNDFPKSDFNDSEYVCWDCYNTLMQRKSTYIHGKVTK